MCAMSRFARASMSAARRPLPAASGVRRHVASTSYAAITPYMTMLMLRNFGTDTWHFKSDGRVSAPGCVIASPSRPDDAVSDQDYVNSWVRDSALCVLEAAHADLPFARAGLLDDYVRFARSTQQNARAAGKEGLACFHIDGSVREWSVQSDGPALRVAAVLDFYDKLSADVRPVAKQLVEEDAAYLLGAYRYPTQNLWEESHGFHFFTHAVQKYGFERILARAGELGLAVSPTDVQNAAGELGERLEDHWTDAGHYRAEATGSGLGGDVDSSVVMGAVYGELTATAPRLLATAAAVWDAFRNLYDINQSDVAQGNGP